MQKIFSLAVAAIGLAMARVSASPVIPINDGTTWIYEMMQETGEEFSVADAKVGPDGRIHTLATYRLSGAQELDGKKLLKFEMHRDGMITNSDLLTVDEHGMFCLGRIDQYGDLTKLAPAQTIVAMPLKPGASWEFKGKSGNTDVQQRFNVVGEEDVDLAAGKFRAAHIHGEQDAPIKMKIDRWFVQDVGIVKDVTEMRMPDGDLLRRVTLELKERPKIAPRPEVKARSPKKFSATVSTAPIGEGSDRFTTETLKIYARWAGHNLREGAKIRAVWIAENIGEIAPSFFELPVKKPSPRRRRRSDCCKIDISRVDRPRFLAAR